MNQEFRCLLRLGPPLTISNREVKPTCADGTSLLRAGEYVDAGFLIPTLPLVNVGIFFCEYYFEFLKSKNQKE